MVSSHYMTSRCPKRSTTLTCISYCRKTFGWRTKLYV